MALTSAPATAHGWNPGAPGHDANRVCAPRSLLRSYARDATRAGDYGPGIIGVQIAVQTPACGSFAFASGKDAIDMQPYLSGQSTYHNACASGGDCPMRSSTLLNIASVSKTMLTALAIDLIDGGQHPGFTLNAPIGQWFNESSGVYAALPGGVGGTITVDMLLHHQSGVPDYTFAQDFLGSLIGAQLGGALPASLRYYVDVAFTDAALYGVETAPLWFTPGTNSCYSNTNALLLGLILEKVAGEPLETLLQEHIFGPAGMNHSALIRGFGPTSTPGRDYGHGYFGLDRVVSGLGIAPPGTFPGLVDELTVDKTWFGFAGGVWSTARDVRKFMHALFEGEIISPARLDDSFTNAISGTAFCGARTGSCADTKLCGRGLISDVAADGSLLVGHGGDGLGWATEAWFRPYSDDLYALSGGGAIGVVIANEVGAGVNDVNAAERGERFVDLAFDKLLLGVEVPAPGGDDYGGESGVGEDE